jgi:hypothetical protein
MVGAQLADRGHEALRVLVNKETARLSVQQTVCISTAYANLSRFSVELQFGRSTYARSLLC